MKNLILAMLLAWTSLPQAQNSKILLDIIIKDDNANIAFLEGARVRVYQGSSLLYDVLSDSAGKLEKLEIWPGSHYTIKVNKEDYALKFGTINAEFVDLKYLPGTIKFPMIVGLVKPTSREDFTFLETQPMIEFYLDSAGNQAWNEAYTNSMLEKVRKCGEGWTVEEVENYAGPRNQGDNLMAGGSYSEAIDEYKKAQQINDTPEIQAAIKDCEIGLVIDESNELFYNQYITLADKMLDNKRHTEAKNYYERALEIKPNERYPQEKIAQCEAIVSNQDD